jgi:hypothetical protein
VVLYKVFLSEGKVVDNEFCEHWLERLLKQILIAVTRGHLISFAVNCSLSFCHISEALTGESQRGEDYPPTSFT